MHAVTPLHYHAYSIYAYTKCTQYALVQLLTIKQEVAIKGSDFTVPLSSAECFQCLLAFSDFNVLFHSHHFH